MAQNYISRGEVITLTAEESYESGSPYRIHGFNGVALITVKSGDLLSFQLEGIFELALEETIRMEDPELSGFIGDLIYINPEDNLTLDNGGFTAAREDARTNIGRQTVFPVFGRAVTATDDRGNFYCRLLQS